MALSSFIYPDMDFPDVDIYGMFVVHAVVKTLPHRSFHNEISRSKNGEPTWIRTSL
jgi:hypothetical protein